MEATANKEVAVIDQQKDLAHLSELEVEITGYKEKFKGLKIDGVEDKDGYEEVRKAIGILRPKRTGLEAERKSVVKPYNDFVKHINSKYDVITTLIQDGPGGELELKKKKDEVDDIIEKQKAEEARLQEQKINDRINELISKGMVFSGEYYSIAAPEIGVAETSIGIVDIRTMSDDLYKNFLQVVVDKSAKITVEKERVAAAEKKAAEEKQAADKKEREEFAAQKKQMEEQQAAMKKQQDEIKAAQDKLDNDKREAEQRDRKEQEDKLRALMSHRGAILSGLGMIFNAVKQTWGYEEIQVSTDHIGTAPEAGWIETVEEVAGKIKTKKDAAEKALEQKLAADKKQKEEADALAEKERQAGLNDQQRMKEYTDALLAVPVPEFKTKKWKATAGSIRDYIADNRPA